MSPRTQALLLKGAILFAPVLLILVLMASLLGRSNATDEFLKKWGAIPVDTVGQVRFYRTKNLEVPRSVMEEVATFVDRFRVEWAPRLGLSPEDRVMRIFLVDSRKEFDQISKKALRKEQAFAGGYYNLRSGLVILHVHGGIQRTAIEAIQHELVHVMMHQWGPGESDHSPFYAEGTAGLFEGSKVTSGGTLRVKQAAKRYWDRIKFPAQKPIPPTILMRAGPQFTGKQGFTLYAYSAALMEMLMLSKDPRKQTWFEVIRDIENAPGKAHYTRFQSDSRLSLRELDEAFLNYLREKGVSPTSRDASAP